MNHITTTAAAELLRVHPNSVVRLLNKEGVVYEMVGKARAYRLRDVERVAAARNKATALEMIKRFRRRR
jgi:GTP cyclohydrolase II